MRRALAAGAAAFGLLLALAASAQAQSKKDMIWCAPVMASTYYWDLLVAVDLGYMDAEGLNLKLVNNDTPVQSLQFIAAGACNIGSITTEVGIAAIEKGADFKFVASEDDKVAFVLLTRPEIKTFADLRGKTVGVTLLQESSATLLRLLLEKQGIKKDDYTMVALGGSPNRLAALINGAIAATMLSPPYDYRAVSAGMQRMGSAFEAFSGVGVVYAVSDQWAKANPDAVTGFLRAAARAERFIYDPANKQKAVEILVKYTKSPVEDISKNYDAFYGRDRVMSPDLNLTGAQLQPWLDLRGSTDKPERYLDLSYLRRAAAQ